MCTHASIHACGIDACVFFGHKRSHTIGFLESKTRRCRSSPACLLSFPNVSFLNLFTAALPILLFHLVILWVDNFHSLEVCNSVSQSKHSPGCRSYQPFEIWCLWDGELSQSGLHSTWNWYPFQ